MTYRHNNVQFHLCGGFCILLAFMFLLVPLRWLGAWLIAGAVHEFGHYTALRLCGKRVYSIRADWNGIRMETEPLVKTQWICALAGPVTSLLLILFYRYLPRIAICAFVQAIANLLPIYPLDGGRVLVGLLSFCFSEDTAHRVGAVVSAFVIALAAVASAHYIGHSFMTLVCLGILLFRAGFVKSTCKDGRLRVQ